MTIVSMLTVGVGGFLGSVARYITVQALDTRLNSFFPYGTLAVNIAGSLVLGIIAGVFQKHALPSDNWKLFLATGFCGGFTTFSAFALENVSLIQEKMHGMMVAYTLVSIILGLLAVVAGMFLGRMLS